jgi:hypothetical protein
MNSPNQPVIFGNFDNFAYLPFATPSSYGKRIFHVNGYTVKVGSRARLVR